MKLLYLKLFWKNKYYILAGIWYAFLSTLAPKRFAWIKSRRSICKTCVYNSKMKLMPSSPFRKDEHCVLCHCNIFLKTASPLSECGISELKKEYPDLNLKWEKHERKG